METKLLIPLEGYEKVFLLYVPSEEMLRNSSQIFRNFWRWLEDLEEAGIECSTESPFFIDTEHPNLLHQKVFRKTHDEGLTAREFDAVIVVGAKDCPRVRSVLIRALNVGVLIVNCTEIGSPLASLLEEFGIQ